jgi:protein-S-isoprenylcysteine O-methyltransferase Ste14
MSMNMLLPVWLRVSGAILVVAGLTILFWAQHVLGRMFSPNLELLDDHKLITAGPYRWVRHPIYSSFFVFLVGSGIITRNWLIGLVELAILVNMAIRIGREEKMMLERFGDQYREYMKTTGRLFPRLRM